VDVVSEWQKRFRQQGLAGLKDRARSGRPRRFGSEVVAGIKALACEPPEARAVPLWRWSSFELAGAAPGGDLRVGEAGGADHAPTGPDRAVP
jgi:hypothetical protein